MDQARRVHRGARRAAARGGAGAAGRGAGRAARGRGAARRAHRREAGRPGAARRHHPRGQAARWSRRPSPASPFRWPSSPGTRCSAGTINCEALLEVEVTRAASDSVLARVVDMVAQAEAQKGPNQRFAQRMERTFAPLVMVGRGGVPGRAGAAGHAAQGGGAARGGAAGGRLAVRAGHLHALGGALGGGGGGARRRARQGRHLPGAARAA